MDTNSIPAEFWMVIVSALTLMLCLILYYFAMLLKEATATVAETRKTVATANSLLDEIAGAGADVKHTIKGVATTVDHVNNIVRKPILRLGSIVDRFTNSNSIDEE